MSVRNAVMSAVAATLVAGCGGSAHRARIVVPRPVAPIDSAAAIRVVGVPAGGEVTLRASRRDTAGALWSASATFRADAHGAIDVAHAAPLRGTYHGVHGMGLFWSMRPQSSVRQGSLTAPSGRFVVTLTAAAGDHVLARRRIVRESRSPGVRVTHLRPSDSRLFGDYYAPPGGHRSAAVLVLGGSAGGLGLGSDVAALLASDGFPALALAYFRAPGLPRELKDIPLEYFARALRRLGREPGVDPQRIAVLGISRGSEAAQLLGVHYPSLVHAVVGYVPSGVVNVGLASPNGPTLRASAWSLHGRPIPYAPPELFGQPDPPGHRRAVIPDERIRGPVLLVSADDDRQWPSSAYAKAIVRRLDAHGFRFLHRDLDYRDAGHSVGVAVPNLSLGCPYDVCSLGGTTLGNAVGRARSWRALVDFLHGFAAGRLSA